MKVRELLSPRGRIGRLCYWSLTILVRVIFELGSAATSLLVSVVKPDWSFAHPRYVAELVCLVVALVLFCIYLEFVLITKRLHDMNMSGWYCLWIYPSVIYLEMLKDGHAWTCSLSVVWKDVLTILAAIILLVFSIMLIFRPGTKGPNRFGERISHPS
ncbi:MAG: DUF805 domain-containing protein [Puniceicoccales bacterium]|jgi:uncharacterized membrane protein YhaH (DUF805 family)|nr:DUF805 domain-containing protein [Puniceicoccales bacterium]